MRSARLAARDSNFLGFSNLTRSISQLHLLFLLGLLLFATAGEGRNEGPPTTGEAEVVDGVEAMKLAIRLSRGAMEANDFIQSREILERVIGAPGFGELETEDRVAAWFALGQTHNALGDHREAVRLYRRILVDHPELVRVRLEMARSFFLLGDDQLADYHFRFVLAGDLPRAVEENVRRFLRQIRLRRRWTFDLGVRFVHNSNINVAPTVRQIELFGLPFELDRDARAKSGLGIGGFVSGEYRLPWGEKSNLRVGGHFDHTSYSDSDFNDTVFAGHAGPHFLFDAGELGDAEVSLLFQGYRRWFGGQKLSYGIGPALEMVAEPGERFRLGARVDHLFVRYDEHGDFDGSISSATVRPALILSATSYATFTLGVAYDRTDFSRLRNWRYRVGIGYHKDLPRGFSVGIEPEYRYITYQRDWPAFGTRRRDHLFDIQAGVLNRRIDLFGFTPVVGYRYQHRLSTIDFYEFDQHRIELTLTRQF